MLDPEDAITEQDALSAIFQKTGLPAEFADQLAAKAFEELQMDDSAPEGSPRDVFLADHVVMEEKINGRYWISRKDLEAILETVTPIQKL